MLYVPYLLISGKTARRHHMRTLLFERYGQYAPAPTLFARLLDAANHTRPIQRPRWFRRCRCS